MSLGGFLFGAVAEGVIYTADEWLPWPRRGKTYRAWWDAKSFVGKSWVVFCWLFVAALLTLVIVTVATMPERSVANQ